MRDFRFILCSLIAVTGILLTNTNVLSYNYPNNSIRFGFGAWDIPDTDLGITVHHTELAGNERLTEAQIAGFSGAFAFSRMLGERFAWEFSTGGFSDSEIETLSEKIDDRYYNDYYDTITSTSRTVSVVYMAMGLIYYPLAELGNIESNVLGSLSSFARPYLTAGIGYYTGFDISWDEYSVTDVYVENTMGVYPGVGLDLMLSRHFIFNVDLRYHFVEFGDPLKGATDYSGMNVVAGFKIAF